MEASIKLRHLTLICLSVLLYSCAAKKVIKSQTESYVDSTVYEKNENIKTEQVAFNLREDIDEVEVVPIDTSLPLVIDGKVYANATVKIKKTKRHITDSSTIKTNSTQEQKIAVAKVEKKKEVEKKQFSYAFLWWLLLLIPVTLAVKRYILK